jgi:hypothetical protein
MLSVEEAESAVVPGLEEDIERAEPFDVHSLKGRIEEQGQPSLLQKV